MRFNSRKKLWFFRSEKVHNFISLSESQQNRLRIRKGFKMQGKSRKSEVWTDWCGTGRELHGTCTGPGSGGRRGAALSLPAYYSVCSAPPHSAQALRGAPNSIATRIPPGLCSIYHFTAFSALGIEGKHTCSLPNGDWSLDPVCSCAGFPREARRGIERLKN